MAESILKSVKKVLGLPEEDGPFDQDVILFINGVFSTLADLGVGPDAGFSIADSSPTWDTFLGADPRLNSVKTYMYLRVRMLFDPPGTSFLMNAMQEQIKEHEWRLNVQMEKTIWTDPDPVVVEETVDPVILDGGSI